MLRVAYEAFTFDDVLLLPAYSNVLPSEVRLASSLTRKIGLNIPMLSAAMDTVTEANLAIALAQEGGMGFIHKNMPIAQQAAQVRQVKKYESGIINQPLTVTPDLPISQLKKLSAENGFGGYPVVTKQGELVGIVTSRDTRFIESTQDQVQTVMTPKKNLMTVHENASHQDVVDLMQRHRIEKVLIVDDAFTLKGMITFKDFQKAQSKPNACKDQQGQLRVGAAVGADSQCFERIDALVEAGVDVLLIDSSHGHAQGVLDCVQRACQLYPDVPVIGGNVATAQGALALVEMGASAVKVGIGPGSICTTRIVTGVGVPQLTAIADVAQALQKTDVSVIADGGIRFSGDIAKAIAAGAHCVMVGSLFAGTEEAPGEIEFYQGRTYKAYRGMGSQGAMSKGSADRYFQTSHTAEKLVPEGVEGRIAYKGRLESILHQQIGGLRSAMGLTGCHTIDELRTKAQFVSISHAGMRESHVHDVSISKEAPNYRLS